MGGAGLCTMSAHAVVEYLYAGQLISAPGAHFLLPTAVLQNGMLKKADLLVLLAGVRGQRTVAAKIAYLGHKG